MKKLLGLILLSGTAVSLSACSMSLPKCYDELNECGRDTAFTEERTAKAGKKPAPKMEMPEPAPMPVAEPAPMPEPEPAPAPVVIDDTPVMQSAEPQFTQVSK